MYYSIRWAGVAIQLLIRKWYESLAIEFFMLGLTLP